MHVLLKIGKYTLIYTAIIFILILIILFPRDAQMVQENGVMEYHYQFSWETYYKNVSSYFTNMIENKSLGGTRHHFTVEEILAIFLPRSLKVIVTAFIISLFFGILKGILDFRHSQKKSNIIGNGTTFLFQAIPDFFLIIIILLLVISYFPFIPIFAQGVWYEFLIPALLVSILPLMYVARITSSAIASQEGLQYIVVAKAKGLSNKIVLYKHVLKNCYSTIFSHCSSLTIYIISNLLMVEYLLSYQGAAFRLFQAIDYRNSVSVGRRSNFEPELIIAIAVSFMLIIMISQIISEVANDSLDPRRREKR